jgi:hypothetical protein
MGGNSFDNCRRLSSDEYRVWLEQFEIATRNRLTETSDYMIPYRLGNKSSYGDIDLVVFDVEALSQVIQDNYCVSDIRTVTLDERYNLHSRHIYTEDRVQIDLLIAMCQESMAFTRAYYSYGCANIFFDKIITAVSSIVAGHHGTFQLTYIGLKCTSNTFEVPDSVPTLRMDATTRLIYDPYYIFQLMDLNYDRYIANNFDDEFSLLDFFKESKYYVHVVFTSNSKFKRNCTRLESFRSLLEAGSLNMVTG